MRVAPVTRDATFQLGVATLAPVARLGLSMMPLEELLTMLARILF